MSNEWKEKVMAKHRKLIEQMNHWGNKSAAGDSSYADKKYKQVLKAIERFEHLHRSFLAGMALKVHHRVVIVQVRSSKRHSRRLIELAQRN